MRCLYYILLYILYILYIYILYIYIEVGNKIWNEIGLNEKVKDNFWNQSGRSDSSPVDPSSKIRLLHLCKGVRSSPPTLTSILDMALNNLMVRPQSSRLGESEVPLHSHYSQVHTDLEWLHLLRSHFLIK